MAVVYRHMDDFGKTFYIGIGKSEIRAFDYSHRSDFWKRYANKYGVNSEILTKGISFNFAKELEILLISEYGRRDLGNGILVNMTDGGDGSVNCVVSEGTKIKMSESHKGKKFNKETRKKISKVRQGEGNGMFGKKPHNATVVYCEYLDKEFNTITSCAKELGISQSHLSYMILGKKENIYNVTKRH
jgi:hypothetical protein